MKIEQVQEVVEERVELGSAFLHRAVRLDFYLTPNLHHSQHLQLLLFNDGQELQYMHFSSILARFVADHPDTALLVVGIHSGPDRKNEYGMSVGPDYQGLGALAPLYERFILEELMPFLQGRFSELHFKPIAFGGFSLGALSALDIVWNHPEVFSAAGVFSGSLWWRSVDKDSKEYNQDIHRMMHQQVRQSAHRRGMRFFFQCGDRDELEDRNKNGVIDSIDDTIDLMRELVRKGYSEGPDMRYLQLPEGAHNAQSWGEAMPVFLKWLIQPDIAAPALN